MDHEKEYEDAFDEASGESDGVTPQESEDAGESEDGGEPGEKAAAPESGDGDADLEDPEASGAESEGGDESGDEAGSGEPPAENDPGTEGDASEQEAASGEEAPKFDEETIRAASELLKQQAKGQQQDTSAEEGQGEEPTESGQEEPDYSAMSWEDFVPEDKKGIVDKYKQEWSEVHEAEEVIRNAQLQLVQEQLYSDLRRALAPVFETTQKLQVNAHLDTIRQAHPDLDNIKQDLNAWIDKQPDFVRPAYQEVAKKGSAEQVIQLVNQFKQAQGSASAVPEVPASPARQQQKAPSKPAKKQPSAAAKRALAAAPSPSTAEVPGSANPDDFDAAWDEIEAGGLG